MRMGWGLFVIDGWTEGVIVVPEGHIGTGRHGHEATGANGGGKLDGFTDGLLVNALGSRNRELVLRSGVTAERHRDRKVYQDLGLTVQRARLVGRVIKGAKGLCGFVW